jgi:hypothetical protein
MLNKAASYCFARVIAVAVFPEMKILYLTEISYKSLTE